MIHKRVLAVPKLWDFLLTVLLARLNAQVVKLDENAVFFFEKRYDIIEVVSVSFFKAV